MTHKKLRPLKHKKQMIVISSAVVILLLLIIGMTILNVRQDVIGTDPQIIKMGLQINSNPTAAKTYNERLIFDIDFVTLPAYNFLEVVVTGSALAEAIGTTTGFISLRVTIDGLINELWQSFMKDASLTAKCSEVVGGYYTKFIFGESPTITYELGHYYVLQLRVKDSKGVLLTNVYFFEFEQLEGNGGGNDTNNGTSQGKIIGNSVLGIAIVAVVVVTIVLLVPKKAFKKKR